MTGSSCDSDAKDFQEPTIESGAGDGSPEQEQNEEGDQLMGEESAEVAEPNQDEDEELADEVLDLPQEGTEGEFCVMSGIGLM